MIDSKAINELIKNRRSIFPKTYIDKPIPKEIIKQVLENANWAPTHKFTEPWRFKVFTGASLELLGGALADIYKKKMPEESFKERKFQKMQSNPIKSGCVITICMQRDEEERIPEWEEIAAVGCAVQNMYLTCTAYGIGSYWSSPGIIKYPEVGEFLKLKEGERCLGFFYMGYHNLPLMAGKRGVIEDKVEWIE